PPTRREGKERASNWLPFPRSGVGGRGWRACRHPPPRTRCARAAPPPSRGRGKNAAAPTGSPSLVLGEGAGGWGDVWGKTRRERVNMRARLVEPLFPLLPAFRRVFRRPPELLLGGGSVPPALILHRLAQNRGRDRHQH